MARRIILKALGLVSIFWRLIPNRLRRSFFFLFLILESRGKSKQKSLKNLFAIEDKLNLVVNERALALGNGVHPKHRLIGYHDFFIENLHSCRSILDIGCGYGSVARSIAIALPNSQVVGIDNDFERFSRASEMPSLPNLKFELSDIKTFKPDNSFDAVILSNVLEHLDDRVEILKFIQETTQSSRFLIRVPLFERHWTVPMRQELGVNFFQDEDHKIEHTLDQFCDEVISANFQIRTLVTRWGEIWSVCEK